jgi:hypothetical protein
MCTIVQYGTRVVSKYNVMGLLTFVEGCTHVVVQERQA